MTRRGRVLGPCLAGALVALAAACGGEAESTPGTYTVTFPSTAAAVATDYVQLLVFDVKDSAQRGGLCQELIRARLATPGSLAPSVPPGPAANICEMLAGKRPVTIPYGEHAILAIAQRKNDMDLVEDFMIGCAIMSIGDGDAPLPIPLRLVSVNAPVPPTTCGSVREYCAGGC